MEATLTTFDWREACCGQCAMQALCEVMNDIPACKKIVWRDES